MEENTEEKLANNAKDVEKPVVGFSQLALESTQVFLTSKHPNCDKLLQGNLRDAYSYKRPTTSSTSKAILLISMLYKTQCINDETKNKLKEEIFNNNKEIFSALVTFEEHQNLVEFMQAISHLFSSQNAVEN